MPWAIAGATAWSLKATYTKHRKHQRIGWLLPATTLYLIFRGTVGIITDSRAAYFGVGIGTKFAIGLGLIGSVVIGKGVAAMYADRVLPFPDDVRVHGIRHGQRTDARPPLLPCGRQDRATSGRSFASSRTQTRTGGYVGPLLRGRGQWS